MTTLLKFQEWYWCLFDADGMFFRKWYLAQLSRDIIEAMEKPFSTMRLLKEKRKYCDGPDAVRWPDLH